MIVGLKLVFASFWAVLGDGTMVGHDMEFGIDMPLRRTC